MPTREDLLRPDESTPVSYLFRLVNGYWLSQSVYVAAKLGIADLLREGPRTAEDLARGVGADTRSLYRLLRGLTAAGIFVESSDGRFGLTPTAEYLRSGVPGSLRDAVILYGGDWYHVWGRLLQTVQTGQTAFKLAHGKEFFEYYSEHPDEAETFNRGMSALSQSAYPDESILEAYDFSSIRTLVDVGGGHGLFLAAVLRASPHLQAIHFDLPQVTPGAERSIREVGLSARCKFVSGDFFQSVPAGGDAYSLKRILHDWDDDQAFTLLRNCRQAMPPGGKLLAIEVVVPPPHERSFGKLIDLQMMVLTGGLERTEQEYRALYAAAGLRLSRIIPTRCPLSVVEGVRA
ncbi:MAG: methyltransferase [Planctomycetes bacterium]|nr:methyltransferase [Planctomycetota bacterium]